MRNCFYHLFLTLVFKYVWQIKLLSNTTLYITDENIIIGEEQQSMIINSSSVFSTNSFVIKIDKEINNYDSRKKEIQNYLYDNGIFSVKLHKHFYQISCCINKQKKSNNNC